MVQLTRRGQLLRLVKTLHDNTLATHLPIRTCSGSHHASYTHNSSAFAAFSMFNEEGPILFNEAHRLEN